MIRMGTDGWQFLARLVIRRVAWYQSNVPCLGIPPSQYQNEPTTGLEAPIMGTECQECWRELP